MRAEPHDGIFAVHALDDGFQRTFQVGERDVLVHHKPFNLMKQRGMGGVYGVGTVNAAGGDYADRRFLLFHRAYLHGGSLCAKQDVVRDVKRVLCVARGVVFRHVERFKIVIVVFNFRPADNVEAHADKDFLDFTEL